MTSAQLVAKRAVVEVLWHQSSRSYEPTADNTRAHSGRLNHPAQTTHGGAQAPGWPAGRQLHTRDTGDERRRRPASHVDATQKPTFHDVRRYRSTSNPQRKPHTHAYTHSHVYRQTHRAELEFQKWAVSQSPATGNSRGKVTARCRDYVIFVKIIMSCLFSSKTANRRSSCLHRKTYL